MQVCTSTQITTPTSHHSVFYKGSLNGCNSCNILAYVKLKCTLLKCEAVVDAEEHCFAVFQKLRDTESDRLPVQVNAYLDNTIDVQSLLEDSDTKTAALERVAELEEALSFVSFL